MASFMDKTVALNLRLYTKMKKEWQLLDSSKFWWNLISEAASTPLLYSTPNHNIAFFTMAGHHRCSIIPFSPDSSYCHNALWWIRWVFSVHQYCNPNICWTQSWRELLECFITVIEFIEVSRIESLFFWPASLGLIPHSQINFESMIWELSASMVTWLSDWMGMSYVWFFFWSVSIRSSIAIFRSYWISTVVSIWFLAYRYQCQLP